MVQEQQPREYSWSKMQDEVRKFYDSLKQQAALLEVLRSRGVIVIIEGITELPIFPHPAADMTFSQFVNTLQNTHETYGSYPHVDGWSTDMWVPQQSSDGRFDDTLFISLAKATDSGLVDQVIVRFDQNNNLTIFGTEIAFHGLISQESTQINTIQEALQGALDNPRRVGYKSEEYYKVQTPQISS